MELLQLAKKLGVECTECDAVDSAGLKLVERELNITFPEDYIEQITKVGLPPTTDILEVVADNELDLHDLWQLYGAAEILSETTNWREIGLPKNLVVIGSDCMGSKFCFDGDEIGGGRKSKAAIHFWDHEFNDTEWVASSFSDWIDQYVAIL